MPMPIECKNCHGTAFTYVGVGIQRIERDLSSILPDFQILRIDSDTDEKTQDLFKAVDTHDVILATNRAISLMHESI